jgi:integrase
VHALSDRDDDGIIEEARRQGVTQGSECDQYISFRRSNTRGDEFMVGTKTGRQERVHLPESALQVLREHIALLESPPLSRWGKPPLWWRKEMAESDLLFAGRDGGPRSPSCLDKPFQIVSRAIGLKRPITPRAMRRTCNDLQRDAKVADVVTMSITGHVPERMRQHYSRLRRRSSATPSPPSSIS